MMARYHVVIVKYMKKNSHDIIKVVFLALVSACNFQELFSLPVFGQLDLAGPGLHDLEDRHDPPRVRSNTLINVGLSVVP